MTDAPAPGAAPGGQPAAPQIFMFEGQPISPKAAAERVADLKADPEFLKAFTGKDPEERQRAARLYADLKQISEGKPSVTELERSSLEASLQAVTAQADERAFNANLDRVGVWDRYLNTDGEQGEVERIQIARNLCTAEQREFAIKEIARLKSDKDFVRRYLAKDMEAVAKMARMHILVSMQVAPDDYDWAADARAYENARK